MGTTEMVYAASALTRVAATPALEVRERAVTQGDPRGQVCPVPVGTGFGGFTWHGSDLSALVTSQRTDTSTRYGAEIGASSVMSNASLGKPRDGYRAMSGTG